MRRAVLFTGQVRDPVRFASFLDVLDALESRERDGLDIVFSTWHNELNAYPEIAARLRSLGTVLIEQAPPNLILTGHVLHQLANLDLACAVLDDDTYVLKIRQDMGHPPDLRAFLNTEPEAQPAGQPFPTSLRYRVRHKGIFGAHPLYINDVTFAAVASDLRHLPKLPYAFTIRYSRSAAEQMYWGAPFVFDIPVLDAYFRVNFGLIFNQREYFEALRSALIDSPLYARVLATSAIIMRDTFRYLNEDSTREAARAFARHHTLEEILWEPLTCPGLAAHPTCYTNWFTSQGVWDALLTGELQTSPMGERFRSALFDYDRPDALAVMRGQRSALRAEAMELGERLQSTVATGPLKHIRPVDSGYQVHQRHTEWSIAQEESEHTRKLERDMNEARRTIGDLTDRLRKAETPS